MDDLTKEFLQESSENLDRLDQDFVKLESDPGNPELVKSIFRTIHTIKGTCGFLGVTQLESVAHVGENLLSRLRDGEIALTPETTTALLQMVDAIRQMLQSIDVSGSEGERNDEELVYTLTRLQQGAAKPAAESHEVAALPAAALEEHPAPPSECEATRGDATDSKLETQRVGLNEVSRDVADVAGKPARTPHRNFRSRRRRNKRAGAARPTEPSAWMWPAGQTDEPRWRTGAGA